MTKRRKTYFLSAAVIALFFFFFVPCIYADESVTADAVQVAESNAGETNGEQEPDSPSNDENDASEGAETYDSSELSAPQGNFSLIHLFLTLILLLLVFVTFYFIKNMRNIKMFFDRHAISLEENLCNLNTLLTKKVYDKECEFEDKIDELEGKLSLQSRQIEKLESSLASIEAKSSGLDCHHKECEFEDKIDELEGKLSLQSRQIEKLESSLAYMKQEMLSFGQKRRSDLFFDSNPPLDLFNKWAANPRARLPGGFSYVEIEGEPKVRKTLVFMSSLNPTKWIVNEGGSKKYLFPNPSFFDSTTDIGALYTMTGSMQPEGRNMIEIVSPCEITDSDIIEYKGEFKML